MHPRTRSLVFLLLLAACGENPDQALRSAKSWSATAQRVGEFWVRGEVPSPYARKALGKAADELRKGPVPGAAAPVDELRDAVERGDRAAARRVLDDLARL